MSNDNDAPAVPINGPVPTDGEYRIVDGTTIEQWSAWAGMWDTAGHVLHPKDAERYVREHTRKVEGIYKVAGTNRTTGALGREERFLVEVTATSVEAADTIARDSRYSAGFEHVQIRAIVPVIGAEQRTARLADAYWVARQAPGGTIVDAQERVHNGPEAQAIYDRMGQITEEAAAENEATLLRCGVPERVAVTASHKDLDLSETELRWRGSFPDGARLDQLVSPPLRDVNVAHDGLRWLWTDDERLMLSYCEGDVSGQLFFTPDAFAAAYESAIEFYNTH